MFVFTENSSRDQLMQKPIGYLNVARGAGLVLCRMHYGTVLDAKASSIGYWAIAFKIGTPHTPSPGWEPI